MKILNSLSLNMIEGNVNISVREINWNEANTLIKNGQSCIGHEDLAKMVGLKANRCTVNLRPGEQALIVQYIGPRLPEGCTNLPKGAKIVPKLISIEEIK